MSRKAKAPKNTPFTAEMAETYFGAIKSDFDGLQSNFDSLRSNFDGLQSNFDSLRSEVNQRLDKHDQKLNTILEVVKVYDVDRKEIKLNLWEHERRLMKLEKHLS
jgi:hypothetical protein